MKYIEGGDLLTIRTALRIEFNDKRLTGADLHKAEEAVHKQVPGLWEPYEEKAFARGFETDVEKWTHDYFGDQVVYLKTNFSKKRWDHLVKVRDYLIKHDKFWT